MTKPTRHPVQPPDQLQATEGGGVSKAVEKEPVAGQPEQSTAASGLSPEEQMARFEDDLRENDWGHQPC